ncbi:hypothetical protein RBB50_004208 [Rhinocladiella similis]
MSNLFDSNSYYRLSSDRYPNGVHLSDGYNPDIPASLYLGTTGYSSENWQIFFQEGIYFLRNYDYGAQYQLAIKTVTDSKPQLLPTSGDLTQQWNITVWPDGTRRLVNMAVGDFQYLGVSNNSAGVIIPVINTAEDGSHWTFDINSSAGEVSEEMAAPLSSIAKVSTTAAATSTAQSTTPATATATEKSSSPAAAAQASTTSKASSLGAGAIAGIVVGVVGLIAFLVAAFLVCARKRKRARARQNAPTMMAPAAEAPTYSDNPLEAYSVYTKDQMPQQAPAELITEKKARTRTSIRGGAVEMPS